MHKEILTKEQKELLNLLKNFSKDFFLVGGTAIALHIGHRQSIDFDLFTLKNFNNFNIRRRITRKTKIERVFINSVGEFTFSLRGVKITFFQYPFSIKPKKTFEKIIRIPSLLDLAAMKAYALGQRAKWKDYIDLFFIIKNYHSLLEIIKRAKILFGHEFNEKNFRIQLAYFCDVDYSEKVIYMPGYEMPDRTIQKELTRWSLVA